MIEAEITTTDANGRAVRGMVGATGAATHVVAQRDVLGEWRALYAVNNDDEQVELPSCFSLNPESVKALDEAAQLHEVG